MPVHPRSRPVQPFLALLFFTLAKIQAVISPSPCYVCLMLNSWHVLSAISHGLPLGKLVLPSGLASSASPSGTSARTSTEGLPEARFDLLLSTDKNIQYQRNLQGRRLAIVIPDNSQRPAVHRHFDRVVTVCAFPEAVGPRLSPLIGRTVPKSANADRM